MRKNIKEAIVTPQPVFIVATYDENGNPNAMNAAWAGQVGPKQVSLSLSPHALLPGRRGEPRRRVEHREGPDEVGDASNGCG